MTDYELVRWALLEIMEALDQQSSANLCDAILGAYSDVLPIRAKCEMELEFEAR